MQMMKNIFKFTVVGLAASTLLTSCIKEVQPTDRALEPQVTLESLITGVPAAMMKAGSAGFGEAWDFGYPSMHLSMDSMTGDLVIAGNIGYDWFQQWGTDTGLGSEYAAGATFWLNYYAWIKAVNDVISKIDYDQISTLTEENKHFLGFAYTYRAMFYLDLVRMYEFKENKYTKAEHLKGLGVPIVLPETKESDAKFNPRAKVEDIYNTLIFPDLDKAENLLSSFQPTNRYAISTALVEGLRARAYLERATETNDQDLYAKAASCARSAINLSGCTPLTQAEWEDPNNGFNNANSNNAWIWGLPLTSENVANLLCFTAHMAIENTWSGYAFQVCRAINKNLYHSITRGDFRRHSWLDPDRKAYNYKSCRPDGTEYFRSMPDYVSIKFRPAQGEFNQYKIGGAADHPGMRVEEMYFIEIEALAHTEGIQSGIAHLNEFMNRYRMTDGRTYDCSPKAGNMLSFLNEMVLQKRIEFWGEGIAMFDMKRLDISTKRGYVGTNAPASFRLNTDGRAPYWNFTIPRNEIQNNTALENYNNPDPSTVKDDMLWKG